MVDPWRQRHSASHFLSPPSVGAAGKSDEKVTLGHRAANPASAADDKAQRSTRDLAEQVSASTALQIKLSAVVTEAAAAAWRD